jgi:hypothetical protein
VVVVVVGGTVRRCHVSSVAYRRIGRGSAVLAVATHPRVCGVHPPTPYVSNGMCVGVRVRVAWCVCACMCA